LVTLGHLGNAHFFFKTCSIKLTRQGSSRFEEG
jgi:hypothetical protein